METKTRSALISQVCVLGFSGVTFTPFKYKSILVWLHTPSQESNAAEGTLMQ